MSPKNSSGHPTHSVCRVHKVRLLLSTIGTGLEVVSAGKQSPPVPSLRVHCSRFSNYFMKNRQSKYTIIVQFRGRFKTSAFAVMDHCSITFWPPPPPLLMEHQMLISQTSIDTRFKILNVKHLNTDPYYHQLLQLDVLFVHIYIIL
jgi:hypothetical protein